jgi:RNA polymerase sigma-70 factor (ECF subfamily)
VIVRWGWRHHAKVFRATLPLEGPAPDALRRDDSRLAALVADHFDFIWRLLRRQGLSVPDADDAAQQVFMVATQKLDSIDRGRERTFLYGVALRTAANARRLKVRRREAGSEDAIHGQVSTTAAPDERAELSRAWALLDELLEQLPDELSRVLSLAEIEELEVREIALLERIPVGTAASRLRRARAEFRGLLSRLDDKNPFAQGKR